MEISLQNFQFNRFEMVNTYPPFDIGQVYQQKEKMVENICEDALKYDEDEDDDLNLSKELKDLLKKLLTKGPFIRLEKC